MPTRTARRFCLILGVGLLTLASAGCNSDQSWPVPGKTFTPAPTGTPTLSPTRTHTAPPTPTAVSTDTPVPPATATATAVPTSTPTQAPEPTATPTESPEPTASATPTTPTDPNVWQLPALGAEADVIFDDLGFPHVFAASMRDAIHTQGYLTAASRFWQMDIFRRVAQGRLSEILGRLTLENDVSMRTAFTTRDGRRLEEALWEHIQSVDPEVANLLQAYSDGVNAWLADLRAGRNGAELPPEYTDGILVSETPDTLDDWRPQDSVAIARLQAWSLSDSRASEISLARTASLLPEELFKDIFRAAPPDPATVLPEANTPRADAPARRAQAAPRPSGELPNPELLEDVVAHLERVNQFNPFSASGDVGSNNWIVSPELSESGHAMLANDPHLALFNPPIWHVIHLDAGDGHAVNGVIFPGLPGVILGHNTHGAWGGTVAVFDVTDVYIEDVTTPPDYPTSPRTVRFRGEQVPVLRIEEAFHVKGRPNPFIQVIEVVPHHGPMVPDPNISDDIVGLAATGMSFRWTGHEMSNDPRFLFDLQRARNVDEFRSSLDNFAAGAQNWIWADIHGDIAYFAKVRIPQRPAGVIPWFPMDGTGSAEWLADDEGNPLWLPDDKIPQATNPPAGYLATANNDQIGNTIDNDPLNDEIYLTRSAADGFRQSRILEMLSNAAGDRPDGAKLSVADMIRFQYDHKSKEAERFLPFLLAAAEQRADLVSDAMADALDRLRAWSEPKPGIPAFRTASGVDPADVRDDVPPRATPVDAVERADAIATSIFVAWQTRLSRMTFADDFAGTGVGVPGGDDAVKGLLHILENIDRTDPGFIVHTKGESGESTLWDDRTTPEVETRDEILLGALARGIEFLTTTFGTDDPEEWLWGAIHRVNFQHFVGQAGPPIYDLGPFPAPGARSTVNPAGYSLNANQFTFSGGPSKRFVALLDPDGVRGFNALPGGNHGNPGRIPGSPATTLYNTINPERHYGDHIPGWINGDVFEYRFRRDEVELHAARRVRLTP